ncbi:MAG: glycosyltransferase family 2 protein [Candidatus Sumerlaeia bacterium]|nr:glycosyltransferase family 2 protein [Candidatus Sumerlaeia bacterium]
MRKVIVVLPAYNEAAGLPALFERFRAAMDGSRLSWQIIAVNDGSSDGTGAVMDQWAQRLPLIRVDHEQNRGLGPALKTGLRRALSEAWSPDDVLVCMDADNTHDPQYVPELAERIAAGADMVICSRFRRGSRQVGVPLYRRILSFGARMVFAVFLRLPGVRDYTCGYRAYRAVLVRQGFEHYGERLIERSGFACTDELLVNLAPFARRIEEIPFVLRYDQKQGRSKLPLMRTVWSTFRLLLHGRRKKMP